MWCKWYTTIEWWSTMAKQILVLAAYFSIAASNPLGQTVCEQSMIPSILQKPTICEPSILSLLSYLASLNVPASYPYGNIGISTTVCDPTTNLGTVNPLGTLGALGTVGNLGGLGTLGSLGSLGALGTLGNLGGLGTVGNLGGLASLGIGYPGITCLPYNNGLLSQIQTGGQQPTTTICETTNLGVPATIIETSPNLVPCSGFPYSTMPMPCPIPTITESPVMPTTTVCETTPVISIPNWALNCILQMQLPQSMPVPTTVCETTSMPISTLPLGIPMSNLPISGLPMSTLPMTGLPMSNLPMTNMPNLPYNSIPMQNMQLPLPMQGLPLTIQIV